jgi:hypothetical protein
MLKVLRTLQLLFCKYVAEIRVAASGFGLTAFLRSVNSLAGGDKAVHRTGRVDYRSHCSWGETQFCRNYLVQRRSTRDGILSKTVISRSFLSTKYCCPQDILTLEITGNKGP